MSRQIRGLRSRDLSHCRGCNHGGGCSGCQIYLIGTSEMHKSAGLGIRNGRQRPNKRIIVNMKLPQVFDSNQALREISSQGVVLQAQLLEGSAPGQATALIQPPSQAIVAQVDKLQCGCTGQSICYLGNAATPKVKPLPHHTATRAAS